MSSFYSRWQFVFFWAVAVLATGCTDSSLRLKNPESLEDVLAEVSLVGDVAVPYGGHSMEVEAVVLVGNLRGTGSDPPPSSERSVLIAEMQKRDVHRPNEVLTSSATSLAIARARLKPGTLKGDQFDVDVFVLSRNETTSLRGGSVYEARLCEKAVLGGRLREGNVIGLAKGPILVDPTSDGRADSAELRRGRVLGGGIALKSRPLGLLIKPDDKDVRTSARIGTAINKRFFLTTRGIKSGVAIPKTDGYVDLKLHPRYKDNVDRYLRVVLSIPLREQGINRGGQLQHLEQELMVAASAAAAAIKLEAIGGDAQIVLKKGLASDNPQVRLHAAVALAYLDDPDATGPLAEVAGSEPALRAEALAALGAMDDPAARDALIALLHVSSAETRYGAFRALWNMNSSDPIVQGESVGGEFSLHRIRSSGSPMIHVTRSIRPEIVVFGKDQHLLAPVILDAGADVRVHAGPDGEVVVARYAAGEPDQKRKVSTRIDEIIRAVVELGGSYSEVVRFLARAKSAGAIACRFEVDAMPHLNREFVRRDTAPARGAATIADKSAMPPTDPDSEKDAVPLTVDPETHNDEPATAEAESEDRRWPITRYVGRMIGW